MAWNNLGRAFFQTGEFHPFDAKKRREDEEAERSALASTVTQLQPKLLQPSSSVLLKEGAKTSAIDWALTRLQLEQKVQSDYAEIYACLERERHQFFRRLNALFFDTTPLSKKYKMLQEWFRVLARACDEEYPIGDQSEGMAIHASLTLSECFKVIKTTRYHATSQQMMARYTARFSLLSLVAIIAFFGMIALMTFTTGGTFPAFLSAVVINFKAWGVYFGGAAPLSVLAKIPFNLGPFGQYTYNLKGIYPHSMAPVLYGLGSLFFADPIIQKFTTNSLWKRKVTQLRDGLRASIPGLIAKLEEDVSKVQGWEGNIKLVIESLIQRMKQLHHDAQKRHHRSTHSLVYALLYAPRYLSGSEQAIFDRVIDVLGATAQLVERMSSQMSDSTTSDISNDDTTESADSSNPPSPILHFLSQKVARHRTKPWQTEENLSYAKLLNRSRHPMSDTVSYAAKQAFFKAPPHRLTATVKKLLKLEKNNDQTKGMRPAVADSWESLLSQ